MSNSKDHVIKVRISQDLKDHLEKEAEKYGVTFSDLVRFKCSRALSKTEADYLTRAFA